MFTGKLEYIRLIYKVERRLKSYTIFGLIKASSTQRIKISTFVRLEQFRGKSEQGANLILRGRDATKWAAKTITGLRPTNTKRVFYGDNKDGNKNLMLFQFSDNEDTMIIDYFNGFYPFNPSILHKMVQDYQFYFQIKKEEA